MPMLQNAAVLAALAYRAAAHGTVQGFVGGGLWYQGYSPSFQYQNPEPVVVGWSSPEDQDNGFVAPSAYANADIICHKGATNAQTQATVAAGSKVEFQWTVWPESHHGPVITYMANCNGACETVDKTTLEFFKIDEGGLVDDSTAPGTWASDQLIANNNSWVTVIPSDIAAGNYVLRHEIIALHSAGNADGAQNYPQCINVKVTGGGSATPSGTLGTALYKSDDPGILVNIYTTLSSYTIPGPTLYSGATTAAQTTIPFSGAASVTSGAVSGASSVVATSAVATSAVASSITPTSTPVASSVQVVAETSTPAISTPTSAPYTASYAPVESFTPSSVSAAPIVSQIAGLTTALPSGVLTSVLPTTPSGTSAASPDATLPDGFTVKDLLEWMMWILENFLSDDDQRQHVRDFHANKRQFGGEQQSGGFAAPSGGFGQGGFPGFGGAAPTGAFPSGFALPTGFSLPTNFPSGAFSGFGGAVPTGFPSGGFGVSGAPAAPTASA